MSLSSSSSSVSASSSADADDVAIVDPPAADHLVVLYAGGLLPLPSDQHLRGDLPCAPWGGIQTHLFLPEDAAVWAAMSVTDLQKMMQRDGNVPKMKSKQYGIRPTMAMALEKLGVHVFTSNTKGSTKYRAGQIKKASQKKVREQVPGLDAQLGKTADGGAALADVNFLLRRCGMEVLTTEVLSDDAGVLLSTQEEAYFFPVRAAAKALRLHSAAELSRKEAAAPQAPKKISNANMLARLLHVMCDAKLSRSFDAITKGLDRGELDARKSDNFVEPWTAFRDAIYDPSNVYNKHHLPLIEQTNEDLQSIDPNDDSIFDHTVHRRFSAKAFKEAFSALRTAHTEVYRAFHSSGQMGTGDKQGKVSWVDHVEALQALQAPLRSRPAGGGGDSGAAAKTPFGDGKRGDDFEALFGGDGGGGGGESVSPLSRARSQARSSSSAAAATAAEEDDEFPGATKSNYPAFCTGKKTHGFSAKLLLYMRYFLEDDESRWSAVTRELTDNARSSSSIGSNGRTKSSTHEKKGRGRGSGKGKNKDESGSRMQVVKHQFPESAGEKRKGSADLKLVQVKEQGELLKQYMQLKASLAVNDDEFLAEQLASIKEQLTQLTKRRKVVRRVAQGDDEELGNFGEDSE